MTRITPLFAIALCVATARSTAAADATPTDFVFNHLGVNANQSFATALRPDQPFTVTIQNTCATQFDYRMYGVPTPEIRTGDTRSTNNPLSTVVLKDTYDSKFGSYLVEIKKKAGGRACTNAGTTADLNEVTLVIAVTPIEWEIGQDAALTLSIKSHRAWTTQAVAVAGATAAAPSTVQKFKVVRDTDHEDPVRGNFVTMTHLYGPGANNGLALGFGLVDNDAEYYFGWSWGLGPRNHRVLNVTAGAVLTPVGALPAGIHQDDLLDDAATLKDFKVRHLFRAYVGFTATFLRSNGGAEKPQAKPES
jgi:hypothetical protein